MKSKMFGCVCNLLLLSAVQLCSQTVTGADLTLQQRIDTIAKYKRSIDTWRELFTSYNNIYSRTSTQVAGSVYNRLYREIIHDRQSVDIMLLLDSSAEMGTDGFGTARKFLARLISMMPADKFRDGSIKVAMLTYSLSKFVTKQFDFSWDKGIYREMVRRGVKRAAYQGGHENHGTSALIWAESFFANSSRHNDSETAKVILYATNGHITDKDLYVDFEDATYQVAHWLKNNGYKIFTVVPGTNVDRYTISTLASEPNTDYVIPVVNTHAAESIALDIKNHKRTAHHHNAP